MSGLALIVLIRIAEMAPQCVHYLRGEIRSVSLGNDETDNRKHSV
jgi:hypothetical protein